MNVRCPDNKRHADDVVGCGKEFEASVENGLLDPEDGWVDCPHCGLFFDPDHPDHRFFRADEDYENGCHTCGGSEFLARIRMTVEYLLDNQDDDGDLRVVKYVVTNEPDGSYDVQCKRCGEWFENGDWQYSEVITAANEFNTPTFVKEAS